MAGDLWTLLSRLSCSSCSASASCRQPPPVLPVRPFSPAAIVGAPDLAGPAAAVLPRCCWARRGPRVLIFYKLAVLRLHPTQVFGETMMLVYYGYALPLACRSAAASTRTASGRTAASCRTEHRRADLAGRGAADAGADLPHARVRPAADRAGALLRRRPPPAARQDRRARHPLHRQVTRPGRCTTNGTTCERIANCELRTANC